MAQEKKYDVFISYRRGNGFFLAQVIRDRLTKKNLSVFLDTEELHSGKFDQKIIDAITEASNFILILTKGALDRCVDEQDWMRREIQEAMRNNKTIIPILYDDFKWPKKWCVDFPDYIKSLENYQAVPGTKIYLSAMIERIVSYMSNVECLIPDNQVCEDIPIVGTLHMATSGLTVVDSLIQGWECENIFRKNGFLVEKHSYKWSDKILMDLQSGKLDVAIYNRESCVTFNKCHGGNIKIIRNVCSSMGGRNFYILASKNGKWKDLTLEQFKQQIDNQTIIAVAKNSDMYQNLLYILDMSEDDILARGVKFIDFHSEQGLDLFNILPDMLLVAGQDIRFLAECKGGFFELISYERIPQQKRAFFYNNSINALLVSSSGMQKMKGIDIERVAVDLMLNFYRNFLQADSLEKIYTVLMDKLNYICDEDDTLKYIVNKILYETYRFM